MISDFGENATMLQYLLEMGMKGSHMLFEPDDIRRAFDRDIADLVDIDSKTVKEVNLAIQKILEIQDLDQQRDYIHELDTRLQDIIIHLYFQMIDRTLYQGTTVRH